MAKQTFKAPTTKAGEVVDMSANLSTGGAARYALIEPDYYLAQVDSLKEETFVSKGNTILKVTPQFTLYNDNQTVINRQDFVVGYVNEKREFYHPDGIFPIWSPTSFLFKALGLFVQEDDEVTIEYYPEFIKDRIISVRTGIAGYVKGNNELSKLVQTAEVFSDMAVEAMSDLTNGAIIFWTVENLSEIIEWFNDAHGLDSDSGLKTKNVITGTFETTNFDVEKHGFYRDERTNAVFATKASSDFYNNAVATSGANNKQGKNSKNW